MTQEVEELKSQLHTYEDGSQVVGVPPFPELSPIQRAARQLEDDPNLQAMNTPPNTVTAADVEQSAESQQAAKPEKRAYNKKK